ncbi:uromodulin-like isoform X2 [Oculina patagonica]
MYTSLAFLLFVVVSLHNAVAISYVPIGCFKDSLKKSRPLPELIKNFRGGLDWNNLNKTVAACAEEAKKKGYLYFGLQFYGECWSGPKAHLTYDRDGSSKNCMPNVGKQRANFVYMLSGDENECIDYLTLDSADRSRTHHTSSERKYDCDHWNFKFAAKRWYRFTGEAGQTMAETCVEPMRCQTLMSGWMDGKHPKVVHGIESRRACFSWINNCCYRSKQIRGLPNPSAYE